MRQNDTNEPIPMSEMQQLTASSGMNCKNDFAHKGIVGRSASDCQNNEPSMYWDLNDTFLGAAHRVMMLLCSEGREFARGIDNEDHKEVENLNAG